LLREEVSGRYRSALMALELVTKEERTEVRAAFQLTTLYKAAVNRRYRLSGRTLR
jgi:hypothetical protein